MNQSSGSGFAVADVTPPAPKVRLGLVADVQHADKENGGCDGRSQFYRSAPEKLARAIDAFLENKVSGVLNLGDSIDGNVDEISTAQDLERVATQFDRLGAQGLPAHHVLGNHCLSLRRDEFQNRVGMPASYYSVQLAEDWKLVVCDTNDLAVHGWDEGTPERRRAESYLEAHPATERDPHMTGWNGGIGDDQLAWLEAQLAEAQSVVLATHHPIHGARSTHLAWNYRSIRALVAKYRGVVKLALAGHDHVGGYGVFDGVHFVTLEAILETPTDAYAFLDIYDDRIDIRGVGTATSRTIPLVTVTTAALEAAAAAA
ncbi:hypothetical protein CTAYLR_007472 [Chrysophaeum taylorii]|uniref:Calcineurin-like phosphoesterase domain-containing protein n=1 Tax=Chrysophaeum taylorii TaxID=2483200 RepID=A0AAD7UB46_9STRA|nr:hypothetical protein CTAYLR_007472 [Chrysophaeum taylorii]